MIARLQKVITLTLLSSALFWLYIFIDTAPLFAWAGFALIACGYAVVLALEFLLSAWLNRLDLSLRANSTQYVIAWVKEVLVAPGIFLWRQPFRSSAISDHLPSSQVVDGRPGVVFVHGFFCNRGFWTPWLRRLKEHGTYFIAINLEPPFASIDDYANQIDDAVDRMTRATGYAPVLVCHSMGGLAVRAWLQNFRSDSRVRHVVTIGTPHHGTWLARFGNGTNGRQMWINSTWLARLNLGTQPARSALFTCWYSNSDNIVFPASHATLPGAINRLIPGAAHVQMAFVPEIFDDTVALLRS